MRKPLYIKGLSQFQKYGGTRVYPQGTPLKPLRTNGFRQKSVPVYPFYPIV